MRKLGRRKWVEVGRELADGGGGVGGAVLRRVIKKEDVRGAGRYRNWCSIVVVVHGSETILPKTEIKTIHTSSPLLNYP